MKKRYFILIFFFGSFSFLLSQEVIQLVPLAPEGHFVNESSYLLFCFPIDDQEFQFVYQLQSRH